MTRVITYGSFDLLRYFCHRFKLAELSTIRGGNKVNHHTGTN
jgi:hypothetical protein